MENLKSNEQRAKNAILLIGIILVLEVISLISDYYQYNLLQSVANGEFISDEMATSNDTRQTIIGILYLVAYIISGITFIQWFRRAYFNLHIKRPILLYDEKWAATSWFVPFLNLFRPFQIMKEMYQETDKLLQNNDSTYRSYIDTKLLGLWWTLWIISGILGQIVFRLSRNAITIDDLLIITVLSLIASVIGIPLAIITIKVIKDYATIEPKLNEVSVTEIPDIIKKRMDL